MYNTNIPRQKVLYTVEINVSERTVELSRRVCASVDMAIQPRSSPNTPNDRGQFVQSEDRRLILVTAHWRHTNYVLTLSSCVCVSVSGWEAVVRGSSSGEAVRTVWATSAIPVVDDFDVRPRQRWLATSRQPAASHPGPAVPIVCCLTKKCGCDG